MSCLDEEAVLDLLDGALPQPEREQIERHIAGCANCRALVSESVRGQEDTGDDVEEGYQLGDSIQAGTEIEHFRVMRLLGEGRTGEVYLCRDIRLGRRVALKVVQPEALGSNAAVKRFLAEARTTARFNHPHIVTIHAAGVWRGLPYLALEYLEGQTLRQRMDHERLGRGSAVRVALALAQALAEAHGGGIVHGDLKPANVILARDGRPRVVDFGLARAVSTGADRGRTGRSPCGTPAYMAPEQWLGGAISPSADIWALGVILYELLVGERPFSAGSLDELRKLVTSAAAPPRCPPEVDRSLAGIVEACLVSDGSARPDAAALGKRLVSVLRPQGERATSMELEERGPFRGLLPFGEQHAGAFFGREPEIAAFLELMRDQGVLTVVGPSGAGKTSFMQAGVVPRLREQAAWLLLRLRPGAEPFLALAAALIRSRNMDAGVEAGGDREREELAAELESAPLRLNLLLRRLCRERGGKVLLLVDQLEELCTHAVSGKTQRAFLQALAGAGDDPQDPVRVVSTLRDDFLGRLAVDPRAREPLGRVTVLRLPEPEALRRVVSAPLETLGYAYDQDELPAVMVREVHGEVTALPLLQFTTQLLWERRDQKSRLLLAAVYHEVGGVAGALARHADSVLEALPPEQESLARAILLRLVNELGTRQVRGAGDLLSGLNSSQAEPVLDHLVSGRLVSVRRIPRAEGMAHPGHEVAYELAHESLLSSWDRLAGWIAGSRQELRLLRELGQAAELWDRRGRRQEELWEGEALAEAERTLDRGGGAVEIPDGVARFLDLAGARERRRRARRRLRWGVAAALLAAVAVISSLVAFTLSRQKRLAVTQRAEAQLQSARSALTRGDPLEARALLRSSLESRDSAQTRLLWWRLQRQPLVWERSLGAPLWTVAMSPDGKLVAAGGAQRTIFLLDSDTRQVLSRLRGHSDQVLSVSFSPDGRRLASGSWNGEVRLWDLGSGRGRALPGKHDGAVWDVAFSPDGEVLASGSYDKTVRLWDVASGKEVRRLEGHGSGVYDLAFSPDGKVLASGSYDKTVRLWDLAGEREARILKGHSSGVYGVAFSPGGELLASAGADATVRLWAMADGRTVRRLTGFGDTVDSVEFSPDGKLLAAGGYDRTVRLFELKSGRQVRTFSSHTGAVVGVAFSPDGRLLASGSRDESLRMWRVDTEEEGQGGSGHSASVWSVAFSPDGRHLASGGRDGSLRIWQLKGAVPNRALTGHPDGVLAVSYSPDGKLLASAGADHMVRIWELRTGRARRLLSGHTGEVFAVVFSPDGKQVASSGYDKTVRLWELKSGHERQVLRGHEASVYGLAFSPDGKELASSSYDKTVRVWDLAGQTAPRVLRGHGDTVYGVAFSPDGKQLASGGADRTVRIWDLARAESRILARLPKRIYWLAFHPGGEMVGVPSADGLARLIPLSGGEPATLVGHRGEVNVLRFSPDGKQVATGGDDGTVRLWDMASREPVWKAPRLAGQAAAAKARSALGQRLAKQVVAARRLLRGQKDKGGAKGEGVTALAESEGELYVGHTDGSITHYEGSQEEHRTEISLRGAPASRVETLVVGPMRTLAAGFESGLVGIWDLDRGQRLLHDRLHGPISSMVLQGKSMLAASELGQQLAWDLSVLRAGYCEVMSQVWQEVGVAWEGGRVVKRPKPPRHPCTR